MALVALSPAAVSIAVRSLTDSVAGEDDNPWNPAKLPPLANCDKTSVGRPATEPVTVAEGAVGKAGGVTVCGACKDAANFCLAVAISCARVAGSVSAYAALMSA